MMEIEYSVLRKKENPAQRFLQRIQDAEKRGLQIKPGQSIDERTLSQFEKTGVQVTSGFVTPSSKLSEEEYTALRTKIFDDYDRHERDDVRREAFRKKLENEQKIQKIGLCLIQNEKKQIIYF